MMLEEKCNFDRKSKEEGTMSDLMQVTVTSGPWEDSIDSVERSV